MGSILELYSIMFAVYVLPILWWIKSGPRHLFYAQEMPLTSYCLNLVWSCPHSRILEMKGPKELFPAWNAN